MTDYNYTDTHTKQAYNKQQHINKWIRNSNAR